MKKKLAALGAMSLLMFGFISCQLVTNDEPGMVNLTLGINLPNISPDSVTPTGVTSRLMPSSGLVRVTVSQDSTKLVDRLFTYQFNPASPISLVVDVPRLDMEKTVTISANSYKPDGTTLTASGSLTEDLNGLTDLWLNMIPVYSNTVNIITGGNFNPFNNPIVLLVPGTGAKLNFSGMSSAQFYFFLQDAVTGIMVHKEYISNVNTWTYSQPYTPGQRFIASMVLASGGQTNDAINMTVGP